MVKTCRVRRVPRLKATDPMWMNKIIGRQSFKFAYENQRDMGFKPSKKYKDSAEAPRFVYKVVFETWNAGETEGWVEEPIAQSDSTLFHQFCQEYGITADDPVGDISLMQFEWSDSEVDEDDLTDSFDTSSDETIISEESSLGEEYAETHEIESDKRRDDSDGNGYDSSFEVSDDELAKESDFGAY